MAVIMISHVMPHGIVLADCDVLRRGSEAADASTDCRATQALAQLFTGGRDVP